MDNFIKSTFKILIEVGCYFFLLTSDTTGAMSIWEPQRNWVSTYEELGSFGNL